MASSFHVPGSQEWPWANPLRATGEREVGFGLASRY
jgi:hypothetical protein